MRMAKMQKATLDPAKISGYCGRLKCCLRYEDEAYTSLKKRLPKKNAKVKTKDGIGIVVDTQILTQLVLVQYEDEQRSVVSVDEIEVISNAGTANEDIEEPERENPVENDIQDDTEHAEQ
jgi:cell fate regulator YaaT (PSP1 superfamily)